MTTTKNVQVDAAASKKTSAVRNFSMKQLFPSKDFFSDAHDRSFCEFPLEIVDSFTDVRAKYK